MAICLKAQAFVAAKKAKLWFNDTVVKFTALDKFTAVDDLGNVPNPVVRWLMNNHDRYPKVIAGGYAAYMCDFTTEYKDIDVFVPVPKGESKSIAKEISDELVDVLGIDDAAVHLVYQSALRTKYVVKVPSVMPGHMMYNIRDSVSCDIVLFESDREYDNVMSLVRDVTYDFDLDICKCVGVNASKISGGLHKNDIIYFPIGRGSYVVECLQRGGSSTGDVRREKYRKRAHPVLKEDMNRAIAMIDDAIGCIYEMLVAGRESIGLMKMALDNVEAEDGNELLRKSIWRDDVRLVGVAVRMGANALDKMLMHAVYAGSYNSMMGLLLAGANPNVEPEDEFEHTTLEEFARMEGVTLLGFVASKGDVSAVNALLDAGAHVDGRRANGAHTQLATPLMVACQYDENDCVERLINGGANVNAVDMEGQSPLLWAAPFAGVATVQLLLAAGAKVNLADRNGVTPLMMACKVMVKTHRRRPVVPRRQVVEILLEAGAEVHLRDSCRDTSLVLLCAHIGGGPMNRTGRIIGPLGYMDGIMCSGMVGFMDENCMPTAELLLQLELLLKGGADVNDVGKRGRTALLNVCMSFVTSRGREVGLRLVDLLLNHGANINVCDDRGVTSLMTAAEYGTYSLVVHLLERGANVEAMDNNGRTAVQCVDMDRNMEGAVALIRGGASVESVDTSNCIILDRVCNAMKHLRLNLLHVCRERIRKCLMHNYPGIYIHELVDRLGLPGLLADYVADVDRFSNI